ncbi:hypothetical protein GHT06_020287 [Daphnia sinensis]|uniref:Retrotransposon gag domain-containing protein n=1 Tax=Daphnia sinensis TaxID=1820382 RepID=A0AAD5KL82_9CRUS|nr:hypothetical protein GHT06_020287 [Daphnia sinensis]
MSGQENRSSKTIQGIAVPPSLPLVTRRTQIENREEKEEVQDTRTTAEDSPRRKCGFNSQAGKRQPHNNQGTPANTEAKTKAPEKHNSKTPTRQPTRKRTADEEGDRSSQGSKPSSTWDTSDLAGHPQGETQHHSPAVSVENEVFADQDLFSPAQEAQSQPEDRKDEDEVYTPRRLWPGRTAGYHPGTDDTDSDDAEGTVGLITSFNYTTPTSNSTTGYRTPTPTQPGDSPTPAYTPTTGRPSPQQSTQSTRHSIPLPIPTVQSHRTANMAAGLLKFKAPPTFSGKEGEDAANWMDRYEVLADYNRWTDADKRTNFGIYLDGPARQWFQWLTQPTRWIDTVAVAATTSWDTTISGMRSIVLKEFLQDSYAGYQERRLRNRKHGINEPAAKYYYEIINLCRLMDPKMSEEAKLHHLYEGLKPTLVEKI